MTDFIRVPPDSTGKRIRHRVLTDIYVSGETNVPDNHVDIKGATSGAVGHLVDRHFHTGEIEYFLEKVTGTFVAGENLTNVAGNIIYGVADVVVPDVHQPQVVITCPDNPDHAVRVDELGSMSVRFYEGQPSMSGFGNLKTAQERCLGVYENSLESYANLFTEFFDNGTYGVNHEIIYNPTEASVVFRVDGTSGSFVRTQTNRYHYYLPGTSNIYKMTSACSDNGKAGCVRRWGAFDENDGMFFELNGTTLNVVLRNSTSGSVVETRIPQSQWNFDRLDGEGQTGIDIRDKLNKIIVWWMDFQWLGAGRVRFGIFAPDGSRVVAHTFENSGQHTLPYMRSGSLPVGSEIRNVAATGSSSELRVVCSAVYAEGQATQDYSFWRYSTGLVSKNIPVSVTPTLVAAYRMKPTIDTYGVTRHNTVQAYPETLNVYCTQPVAITFFQSTAYTPGAETWAAASAQSLLERSTDIAFNYAESESFTTFFCNVGANVFDLTKFFELNDEGIQVAADGTPQVWSIAAKLLTASTSDVTVNISYKELW